MTDSRCSTCRHAAQAHDWGVTGIGGCRIRSCACPDYAMPAMADHPEPAEQFTRPSVHGAVFHALNMLPIGEAHAVADRIIAALSEAGYAVNYERKDNTMNPQEILSRELDEQKRAWHSAGVRAPDVQQGYMRGLAHAIAVLDNSDDSDDDNGDRLRPTPLIRKLALVIETELRKQSNNLIPHDLDARSVNCFTVAAAIAEAFEVNSRG